MKGIASIAAGIFFLAILCAGLAATALHFPAALSRVETLSGETLLRGTWASAFEKALDHTSPLAALSRNIWGRLEYTLFHEGRAGVVVGKDGWLFTAEEFSCPPRAAENLAANLAYVSEMAVKLDQAGTKLVVVLIPAKSRVVGAGLPACRASLYADILLALGGMQVVDLSPHLLPRHFFKTDTHWMPEGAHLAAQHVAAKIRTTITLPDATISLKATETVLQDGDLQSYIPGVRFPPTPFTQYNDVREGLDLLGDMPPPAAVLVGTSYSANVRWSFAGFLKNELHADIDNAAREGEGPFAAMEEYLASTMPPRLVIWEMPERYFLLPRSGGSERGF